MDTSGLKLTLCSANQAQSMDDHCVLGHDHLPQLEGVSWQLAASYAQSSLLGTLPTEGSGTARANAVSPGSQ